MGWKKHDTEKQDKFCLEFIKEMELDLIEFTSSDMEVKLARLPITDPKSIRSLIWNLNNPKYMSRLSYKDWDRILEILMERIT